MVTSSEPRCCCSAIPTTPTPLLPSVPVTDEGEDSEAAEIGEAREERVVEDDDWERGGDEISCVSCLATSLA